MAQSNQMIETLDDCFFKTADNIMKYYVNEEEKKKTLEELRSILKESCSESARILAASKIKEQLELTFDPEAKNVEDIIKEYKEAIFNIQVDLSEYNRLLEYDRQIEVLHQANEDTPSNELDDTDADLQLTGLDINVIDPISKTRMTNPVKNAACGHVYDKASLIAMLEKNKNTRCPVVGCTNLTYIDLNQCRTDIVTKTYLERNPV
ncbi:E3 SUMO-protein ligase NSE2 [Camponotus floridanus]|uniref:E3 SUMO-protein ligase NSE2 n=1 Tax=Camponotus floridanus TaxID=104421 RepID=E2AHP7_CAMFO|nr:E3 SUMO-protein ligase NSE2 [Camponotus floridanus]EFN67027.1 E3 SUMO-protein ligase NSE2 [Camponotus floridanus]